MHYNGANSYLFVNGTKIVKFKVNDSEIVASLFCFGNISKDWSTDNMKKTGLSGYVYEFTVDCNDFNKTNPSTVMSFVHELMSRINKTRHIKWHGTCNCKCRLDASVCNNKQRRNNDKCHCEC